MNKSEPKEMDVTKLLPDGALGRLILAWNDSPFDMVTNAAKAATSRFPQVGRLVTFVASYLYKETPEKFREPTSTRAESSLEPRDRERCLIAIFTSHDQEGYAMPIHIYWGLMVGLSVREIADTVALAGGYGGLPVFINGMDRLASVLAFLAEAAGPTKDDLSPGTIARNLRQTYAITR